MFLRCSEQSSAGKDPDPFRSLREPPKPEPGVADITHEFQLG
jgi:hypothetical protein